MKYNGALKNRHLISNEMKRIQTQNWFTDPSLSSSRFFSHRSDCGCIDLCPLKNQGCILGWHIVPLQLGTLCGGNEGDWSCRLSSISFNDSLTHCKRRKLYMNTLHYGEEDLCRGFFSLKLPFRPSDQCMPTQSLERVGGIILLT